MMTRKHFERFAEAIRMIKDDVDRENVVRLVGTVCHEDNANFDWTRFRVACGCPYDDE